jgi:signal peptidase I
MPLLVIIIPMLLLVSGVLKYQMMAVASNSMYPIFERGDALIYEKLSNE